MSEVKDRSPELASAAEPSPASATRPWEVRQVEITADGTRGSGEDCPVARACRQVWPGCEPHIEGPEPHIILANGVRKPLLLAPGLIEEIGRYDREEGGFEKAQTLVFIGGGA